MFADLRPLVATKEAGRTAALSRDHTILVSDAIRAAADPLAVDGGDLAVIRDLMKREPERSGEVHPRPDLTCAEVIIHARREMARTVGDVLARRSRILLLDAQASRSVAPRVGHLLASELGCEEAKIAHEIDRFQKLAAGYFLEG